MAGEEDAGTEVDAEAGALEPEGVVGAVVAGDGELLLSDIDAYLWSGGEVEAEGTAEAELQAEVGGDDERVLAHDGAVEPGLALLEESGDIEAEGEDGCGELDRRAEEVEKKNGK